jgi:hypothetical protein
LIENTKLMNKVSKKDVRAAVTNSITSVMSNLHVTEPSKKTTKLLKKVSKKLSLEFTHQLKKQMKKMEKATKKNENKVALSA